MRFSFQWGPPPPPPPESILDWLRSLLLGAPPSPAPPPPRSLGSVLALLWSRLLGPLPSPPSPPPPPPPPTPSEQPIWLWLMLLFCAIAAAFGLFVERARWHLHGRQTVVDAKGTYEADFRHGRPIGPGRYTWAADGHVFDGEFEDGVPNGFGVKSDKNGRLLQCGRWARGLLVESRPLPLTKVIVDPSSAGWAKHFPAASHHRLLLLPNSHLYVGDFNADFQPHGQGTQFRGDGSEAASGQWRNGKQHGRGKIFPSGSRYEGNFVDDKMSGVGAYTWADGRVFEGEWANDKGSGFGVMWGKDGKVRQCGHWADGYLARMCPVPRIKIPTGTLLSASARAANAERTLLLPDGGHYVGEFNAHFRPHGQGTEFRTNGTVAASGQWRDGKLHGRGKLILSSGDRYEGDFVAGEKNGLGTYTWARGGVFEGQFYEGQFNGRGILWTAEGEVDKCGWWILDMLFESCPVPRSKMPVGTHLSAAARAADPGRTLLLPDGSHYVGDFNADFKPHGRGTRFRSDGSEVASGQWRDGQLHGRGKWINLNGDRYQGDFVGGVRCGVGTHFHGGKVGHGEWADGRMSGFGLQWNRNGELTECGRWTNGRLTQLCAVPRSKIPLANCKFLPTAARTASLLYPDGRFYRGVINAQFQRHGKGSMHAPNGRLEAAGVWRADRLLTAAESAAAAAAATMPFAAASSSSSGRPVAVAAPVPAVTAAPVADIPECVVCQDAPRECFIGCPHVCMCMDCAAQVPRCPMCRAPVNQRLKVFIS